MKKYKLLPVVLVLVLAVVAIGSRHINWTGSVSASGLKPGGFNLPMYVSKTITTNGLSNIGGVCTVELDMVDPNNTTVKLVADAEVPVDQSKVVPFNPVPDPKYSDESLLFPGCHVVHYKQNTDNVDFSIVSPMDPADGNTKICFGATPELTMAIYYYPDTPASGTRTWTEMASTLEDQNRLICASAPYTGVYMPSGKILLTPVTGNVNGNGTVNGNCKGTVCAPPTTITYSKDGTYNIGGICTIKAQLITKGLSDTVSVEYAEAHLTQDTIKVPTDQVDGLFYFPGCHVLHYLNNVVQDQVTADMGTWQICFAAIPDKTMTIYYYQDDLTNIIPPWKPLETTTKNGIACADIVDWSGVYAPVGK